LLASVKRSLPASSAIFRTGAATTNYSIVVIGSNTIGRAMALVSSEIWLPSAWWHRQQRRHLGPRCRPASPTSTCSCLGTLCGDACLPDRLIGAATVIGATTNCGLFTIGNDTIGRTRAVAVGVSSLCVHEAARYSCTV